LQEKKVVVNCTEGLGRHSITTTLSKAQVKAQRTVSNLECRCLAVC